MFYRCHFVWASAQSWMIALITWNSSRLSRWFSFYHLSTLSSILCILSMKRSFLCLFFSYNEYSNFLLTYFYVINCRFLKIERYFHLIMENRLVRSKGRSFIWLKFIVSLCKYSSKLLTDTYQNCLNLDGGDLFLPPVLPLSAGSLSKNGAFLLDNGCTIILWVFPGVSANFLSGVLGCEKFSELKNGLVGNKI